MIRMNVNRILPLMLLLVLFASCSRKYKVEGVSSRPASMVRCYT